MGFFSRNSLLDCHLSCFPSSVCFFSNFIALFVRRTLRRWKAAERSDSRRWPTLCQTLQGILSTLSFPVFRSVRSARSIRPRTAVNGTMQSNEKRRLAKKPGDQDQQVSSNIRINEPLCSWRRIVLARKRVQAAKSRQCRELSRVAPATLCLAFGNAISVRASFRSAQLLQTDL